MTDLYAPVLPAILPLLILQDGYPYLLAGLLVATYNLTSSLLQPVIGWLYDTRGVSVQHTSPRGGVRTPVRRTGVQISTSLLMSAVFISLIGIAGDYYLILICAALGGLGHALFHPVAFTAVSRLTGDESRGRITSYFVIGGNLGFAIGPVITGIVVVHLGLSGLLLLMFPGLAMAGVIRLLLPSQGRPAPPPVKVEHPSLDRTPPQTGEEFKHRFRETVCRTPTPQREGCHTWDGVTESPLGDMFKHRFRETVCRTPSLKPAALLVAGASLRAWAIFAAIAYLPTFFIERGFNIVTANIVVSALLLCGVAGQVIGGTLSDLYGRKEYTLFGVGAALIPFVVFLATDGYLSIIALMVFGFLLWSTFSVTVAMAHEMVPESVGTISGLMLGAAVGAGGMGVLFTGWLADRVSLAAGLAFIIPTLVAALILFTVLPYPWKSLGKAA